MNINDPDFVVALREVWLERIEDHGLPRDWAVEFFTTAYDLGRAEGIKETCDSVRRYGLRDGLMAIALTIEAESALLDVPE
jgi:hypothetical protein